MKGVTVDLKIECDCGVKGEKNFSSDNAMPVRECSVTCLCGVKYFIHIQEVKKPS